MYQVQGGPSASGKKYVDNKREVTFICKFILWPRPPTELGIWRQHLSYPTQMGHPVVLLRWTLYNCILGFNETVWTWNRSNILQRQQIQVGRLLTTYVYLWDFYCQSETQWDRFLRYHNLSLWQIHLVIHTLLYMYPIPPFDSNANTSFQIDWHTNSGWLRIWR